ncbi:hypothetical protein B7C51_18125 [Paenibacillus larvae subsp. pulvifaciens]|uniref:Uncharacterized protein n=1 Tax=Paenibacillus larvae subsp. pulvifaciens TaxID=1477 RepID=A0A1V0UWN7_9BACL|nr:hypothetical protein [Paenibacillus larvae]ARF69320.1 hypothetical protein B7C51_18125 [Paenibacillus larvae subsp. pulvifaciens]
MSSIMLRPDLKTAGGEVNDVLVNGKYVGSVSIIYREGDRMFGAVQLEKHSLGKMRKVPYLSLSNSMSWEWPKH